MKAEQRIRDQSGFPAYRIKCFLLIVIVMLSSVSLHAQKLYRERVYDEIQKTTYTYFEKDTQSLKIDVYQPSVMKDQQKPVLLYVHGGGFAIGKRDSDVHNQFCIRMARKGYMACTMDYTLYRKGKSVGCNQPATNKIETFLKAGRDISRAVRFLLSRKDIMGVDTTKIVLLGSSAGAEAVLHAAYWKETYRDETGEILPFGFKYAGVISMAGAITDINLIDEASAIPTQLFHGTCDPLVPYATAAHHYCNLQDPGYLMLFGAYPIMKKLGKLGESYYLVTGCHGGHEWNIIPMTRYLEEITDFLYHDVIRGRRRQIHHIIPTGNEPCFEYNSFFFCK